MHAVVGDIVSVAIKHMEFIYYRKMLTSDATQEDKKFDLKTTMRHIEIDTQLYHIRRERDL